MKTKLIAAGLFAMFGLSLPAFAVSVQYELTPLGGSNYRYVYTVSNDGSLGSGASVELFDVMFDPALYLESSLVISTPASPGSSWDEIFLVSAPGVPAAYDAMALAGGIPVGAALGGFSVDFAWIGTGTPGNQPFAIYDPGSFALLAEGMTGNLAAVPVPAAAWLLGSGIAAMLGFCRQRKHRPSEND